MRFASCLVLLAVLAAVAVQGGLKTVYTIPLPKGPSSTEFYNAGASDMYFTVGAGGALYGVNLTSKKVQYTQQFDGENEIGGIYGLGPGLALVDGDDTTFALSPKGSLLWVSGDFTISNRKHSHVVENNTLFVASEEDGTLSAIDILTGQQVGQSISINSGVVFPTEAIVSTSDENGDNEVVSYAIPSFKKKWGLEVNAYLAQNKDYLLVSRDGDGSQSGITEVLVLNPSTLGLISTLKNCDGIESNNNFEIVNEHFFLAELGYSGRVAYFDLKTGKKIWEFTPDNGGDGNGGGFFITKYSLVTISQTDLHFINITDGKKLVSKTDVPYTADHTITAAGDDVTVSNLQGYTTWNAKTGAYVGRNEMAPSTTGGGGTSYVRWGRYYVSTVGAEVVVQEED